MGSEVGEGSEAAHPGEVARFIALMAEDLQKMAARSGLGFVAYLLAMASQDAAATAERLEGEAGPRG